MKDFFLAPTGLLLCWLVIINLASFCAFGVDKWKSKRKGARRIPERNLILSAVAGGSVGALLGMQFFRHKTLHRLFSRGLPTILIGQLAVGLYVYIRFFR